MKVSNQNKYEKVSNELLFMLDRVRRSYREPLVSKGEDSYFVPKLYVKEKVKLLNAYLERCGLDTVVVALSGGVDSALVLKLLEQAKKAEGSPIKRIVGVTLPIANSVLTNQFSSVDRVNELVSTTDCEFYKVDLSEIYKENVLSASSTFGSPSDWAEGQMGAYIRTSFLYFITSVLADQNSKPVLVGTTNRDEGSYIGYVGKASDGMVDLQLISDIYKSEVYLVAEYLGVPESILTVAPNGDMFSGKVDEQVFGAPYPILELFNRSKSHPFIAEALKFLSDESKEQWEYFSANLEKLHNYNKHKYIGLSPAVHLDLWSTEAKGGYINYCKRTKEFLGGSDE